MIFYLFIFILLLSYLGEAHSLEVEKVLFKEKSKFQEVLIFEVCILTLQIYYLLFACILLPYNCFIKLVHVNSLSAVLNIWESACT
jgi:hypothetical protein